MAHRPDPTRRRQVQRRAFWRSASVLLRFKALVAWAMGGAVVSALCFGSGIALVLPILKLLVDSREPLGQWFLARTRGGFLEPLGQLAADHLPLDPFAAFGLVMIVVALLSIVGSLGRYLHELLTITVVERAAMVWRTRLYRRLIQAPLIQVLASGHADNMSRVVTDTRVMATGYRAVLGKAVTKLFSAAAALVTALVLDWALSLVALAGAGISALMLRKFGKVIRRASSRALRMRGDMLAAMGESLRGIRVVKVHNSEGYERRRFARLNRGLYNEEMKMRRVKAISSPMVETLGLWSVILVATLAAWVILQQDQAEPARFMTVLVALSAAANSFKPLSTLSNTLYEASAAAERVLQILQVAVEPTGAEANPEARRLARHQHTIEFDSVRFSYPGDDRSAVRGVSLAVQQGQLVAVVGPNGSGKTTLLSMIPRLLEPTHGRVLIDATDIRTVSLRSLREQIGFVTQDPILFEGSIADNIAYGQRHVSLAQIEAAAATAGAQGFIATLPDGYRSQLQADGSGLSGGQRQRLCIARALLRDPAILILDEATSQIDADSEAQISEALWAIRPGRTTFVIAHRLSTVIDADRIIVMEQGAVVDQGRHDQLLERCPTYRLLTRTQMQPLAV